jgi:hypothetical protein
MLKFNVYYEIVTPESAEQGDVDERGEIATGLSLREAIAAVNETRTSLVGGVECIEASDSRVGDARWFTVTNGMEFETGAVESRSLHIPDHVTPASRRRIARLLGVRV